MISDIISIAKKYAFSVEGDVLISGSIVAGLETPQSDIDMFIFGEDSINRQEFIDNKRIDIQSFSYDYIYSLINKLEKTQDPYSKYFISYSEINLLGQILIGQIIKDNGRLDSLKKNINNIYNIYLKARTARLALGVANNFEDAKGFNEISENEAEIHSSMTCLLFSVKAFLGQSMDLHHSEKWTWTQWKRIQDYPEGLDSDTLSKARSMGPEIIRYLAQDLLVWSITGIKYTSKAFDAKRANHITASTFLAPVQYESGCALLSTTGSSLSLSPKGMALWGISRGRTYDETINLFCEQNKVSKINATRYLDKLINYNLIEDPNHTNERYNE